jgi:hypothetical protein
MLNDVTQNKRFLMILFFASVVLRILFFLAFTRHGTNAWIYVDSDQYHQVAHNIAVGNGISLDGVIPQHYRLPGYPLFLAGCYSFFGERQWPALIIQIILTSLIPVLMFMLASVLLPCYGLIAYLAGIIGCIHPGFILYSGMLATESLTLLFLLLFFIIFFSQGFKLKYSFSAGIFLGLASLFRPVGHYLLCIAIVLLLLRNTVQWRNAIKLSVIMSTGWLIVVIPWLIRNYILTGAVFFHSLPGLHFQQYLAAPIVTQRDQCSYPAARAHVLAEWNETVKQTEEKIGRALDDYERCKIGESRAVTYAVTYPWYAIKHAGIELFKTCAGLYSAIILLADGAVWPDYGAHATWWDKVNRFVFPSVKRSFLVPFIYCDIVLMVAIMMGFVLLCCYALFDKAIVNLLITIIPFIAVLIFLTLAYGGARLRMPAEPLLIIGAIIGWLRGLGLLCKK